MASGATQYRIGVIVDGVATPFSLDRIKTNTKTKVKEFSCNNWFIGLCQLIYGNGFAPDRQQNIVWSNFDQHVWCDKLSLGSNEWCIVRFISVGCPVLSPNVIVGLSVLGQSSRPSVFRPTHWSLIYPTHRSLFRTEFNMTHVFRNIIMAPQFIQSHVASLSNYHDVALSRKILSCLKNGLVIMGRLYIRFTYEIQDNQR